MKLKDYTGTTLLDVEDLVTKSVTGISKTLYNQHTNLLDVDTKSATVNGYIEKIGGDASSLTNCPISSGTVVFFREIRGGNGHYVVYLHEVYPQPNRIWKNVYNTAWQGWKSVTSV